MLASPEFLAHAGSEVTMPFDSFASALGAFGVAAVLASWTSSWTLACLAFFLSLGLWRGRLGPPRAQAQHLYAPSPVW